MLPFVTAELPGVGGACKVTPEDFRVDELPSYLPSGAGDHTMLRVEKVGLDTREVVGQLARALSVSEREVGVAGRKDRFALTTQWLSVPKVAPERALALALPGVRVLEAARHGNKLRVGHLRGNRFGIRLRGTVPDALPRARALADALAERGLPNFYGPQRFGRSGDNAELGRRLLLGDRDPAVTRAARNPTHARFLVSAFQSEVFNRVLATRLGDGTFATPLPGDVLVKLASGGLFRCESPETDEPRVRAFELSITGPMPGARPRLSPTGAPAELEERLLAETGVTPSHLARSKDAEGTRRALRLPLSLTLSEPAPGELWFEFELPPGSYATVVLREFTRTDAAADLGGE